LIEVLVRLEPDPTRLPQSYKLLKLEAPDKVGVKTLERERLLRHWMDDEIVTHTTGDEWLASASAALLRVPSAVVPETWNVLLNPQQEDAPIEGGLAQILSLGPQALRIVLGGVLAGAGSCASKSRPHNLKWPHPWKIPYAKPWSSAPAAPDW
jgi:RES domain